MINRKIIEEAANDYNQYKYPEEFYTYHLDVLQNAQGVDKSVSEAVKYLFLWKLGKIRIRQTPSGSRLKFSDSKGNQYYSITLSENHNKIIKKAIEEKRLEIAINFRKGKVRYEEFKPYADELSSSTIVLPAFYIHIWLPNKYPVLDEKVWKVFCNEKGRSVSKYTKPKTWEDFEAYTVFFKEIVKETGLDWRTVDRGLWVLGKRLKKKITCTQNRKFCQRKKTTLLKHCGKETKPNLKPIPINLLNQICYRVNQSVGNIPFKYRGITITQELIKAAVEILNAEPTKMLPQNSRNDVKEKTPDGLDRRIKEYLNTNLRTANIISDVLEQAGIVEIISIMNFQTGRRVKGTKLLKEWCW